MAADADRAVTVKTVASKGGGRNRSGGWLLALAREAGAVNQQRSTARVVTKGDRDVSRQLSMMSGPCASSPSFSSLLTVWRRAWSVRLSDPTMVAQGAALRARADRPGASPRFRLTDCDGSSGGTANSSRGLLLRRR